MGWVSRLCVLLPGCSRPEHQRWHYSCIGWTVPGVCTRHDGECLLFKQGWMVQHGLMLCAATLLWACYFLHFCKVMLAKCIQAFLSTP